MALEMNNRPFPYNNYNCDMFNCHRGKAKNSIGIGTLPNGRINICDACFKDITQLGMAKFFPDYAPPSSVPPVPPIIPVVPPVSTDKLPAGTEQQEDMGQDKQLNTAQQVISDEALKAAQSAPPAITTTTADIKGTTGTRRGRKSSKRK